MEMAPSARPRRAAAGAEANYKDSAADLRTCSLCGSLVVEFRIFFPRRRLSATRLLRCGTRAPTVGPISMRISAQDSSHVEEAGRLYQKVAFGYLLVGITTVALTLYTL